MSESLYELSRVSFPQTEGIVPNSPMRVFFPSGLKATLKTPSACPVRVRMCRPVLASHRRTLLSRLPDVRVFPSGLNATLLTQFVCPVSLRRCLPETTSHRQTVLSELPDTIVLPSGLNATLLTHIRMSCEGAYVSSRLSIPQTEGIVRTPRCERATIGTERHAID